MIFYGKITYEDIGGRAHVTGFGVRNVFYSIPETELIEGTAYNHRT